MSETSSSLFLSQHFCMTSFSQTGLAARVNDLRDEELYLRLLQEDVIDDALTALEGKLVIIQGDIERTSAWLSMNADDLRSQRSLCLSLFSLEIISSLRLHNSYEDVSKISLLCLLSRIFSPFSKNHFANDQLNRIEILSLCLNQF